MVNKNIQAAKEAREIKNKLMLVNGPFNAKQLLHILQNTPQKYIYKRKGKGGGTWEYVEARYMKKVLNYICGWLWDFEIKEHGEKGKLVWVLGRLTIRDKKANSIIIKEQFGRSEIKQLKSGGDLDFGNDLKSAASDALKKCASELGIASDVYGRQEVREIDATGGIVDQSSTPLKNSVASSPSSPELKCVRCKANITRAEADYSKRIYKSILCRNCQKNRVKQA